ncbi:MAG: glycosyltransferase family 2 protein [Streptosporangiaceae bacterium]
MTAALIDVTVITLTRNRPDQLQRAIRSIDQQRGPAALEHLVLIDDCLDTVRLLESRTPGLTPLRYEFCRRAPEDRSGPSRSATLRNQGVRMAAGDWIAFLDDDNEFAPDHIATLADCARSAGVRAVHSWLTMRTAEGCAFTEPRDPWRPDLDSARSRYHWAIAHGVRVPGSPVFRDRIDGLDHPDPVRTVDTGEWLLRRDLLLDVPFPTDIDGRDKSGSIFGEDDALMEALLQAREPVICSEKPTLIYHLGGYSNAGDVH